MNADYGTQVYATIEAEAVEACRRHATTNSILSGWSWYAWGLRRALALHDFGPEAESYDLLNAPEPDGQSDFTAQVHLRSAVANLNWASKALHERGDDGPLQGSMALLVGGLAQTAEQVADLLRDGLGDYVNPGPVGSPSWKAMRADVTTNDGVVR